MFTLFAEPTINKQIRLYVSWKAIRHPSVATAHERVLKDFLRRNKYKCVTQIDRDAINDFIESRSTEFFKGQARIALRAFFMYWCKMGLLTRDFDATVQGDIVADMQESLHPRLRVDQVHRVKKLRATMVDGKPMSFRQIKLLMETEDGRTYDLQQIHRWSKYVLPELSPDHTNER